MPVIDLPLEELEEYQNAEKALTQGDGPIVISGCADSEKIQVAAKLGTARLCLFVTYSELRAREIVEDAEGCGITVWPYRARDLLFYQADVAGNLLTRQRMDVWQHILSGEPGIVVTTVGGCMDRLPELSGLADRVITLAAGQVLDRDGLIRTLTDMGYSRETEAEMPGQFAVRGGILDIWPLTAELPCRLEFFGDEIDMLRTFDPDSKRSIENTGSLSVCPAAEEASGRPAVTFPRYFGPDSMIFLDEPVRLFETAETILAEFRESMASRLEKGLIAEEDIPGLASAEEVMADLASGRTAALTALDSRSGSLHFRHSCHIRTTSIQSYHDHFPLLIEDLKKWHRDGFRVVLLVASRTRAQRMAADLRDYGIYAFFREEAGGLPDPGTVMVTEGVLHHGFSLPDIRFVVLSESDVFGKKRGKTRPKVRYEGKKLHSFSNLKVGDYVVHEIHGLGIYRGTEQIEVRGTLRDYLKIGYADEGNLYIPVTQLNQVQKYADGDASGVPRLNRLGGSEWGKTKARVKKAVREIAEDLVRLYSARMSQPGFAFSPDTVWQTEFEEQFPYEETEDQTAAIEATKKDMQSSRIMDRLICGDVGYGKTEIAIRAAFKAVQDGKQVAVLCPTTILAQQHYHTFIQRMKDYPVRIRLLSRFRTAKDIRETVEQMRSGEADIIIGTHRLLSADIRFRDLGLLVIDEEQRFGVADKEKIKKLRENVDVLALTATPIPRTLHMSLVGIRDMSVLEEPPMNRVAIQTFVMEYDEEIVREAIERELARGGQVYYVYNRVNSIADAAAHIARLVPEANVAAAHGQMRERDLEQIMLDFINGQVDVLVTTTIIETGLDISNVNTIIIHDADRFGLAQLYQLRGRVGRSSRTAFAFLLYRRDKTLREEAEKRLKAIREYTELGSGIRIAMRDLEIRGAGNLLGAEQHGHLRDVGYDYYCKLMNDAVRQLKGGRPEEAEFETSVDLPIDAYIPSDYIRTEAQKMNAYRRIAAIESAEDAADVLDELTDRYGEIPAPVASLLSVARLRSQAHEAYVTEITGGHHELSFAMLASAPVDTARLPDWLKSFRGRMAVTAGKAPVFTWRGSGKELTGTAAMLETAQRLVDRIKLLIDRPN